MTIDHVQCSCSDTLIIHVAYLLTYLHICICRCTLHSISANDAKCSYFVSVSSNWNGKCSRQTEISEFNASCSIEQKILRLEVAV